MFWFTCVRIGKGDRLCHRNKRGGTIVWSLRSISDTKKLIKFAHCYLFLRDVLWLWLFIRIFFYWNTFFCTIKFLGKLKLNQLRKSFNFFSFRDADTFDLIQKKKTLKHHTHDDVQNLHHRLISISALLEKY